MSLAVGGSLFAPPFDRRTAPPVPFPDLLDPLDSPDTPGTTYSFQEPPQQKPTSMQAEPIHLSGLLDHHILPTTDDEMMDSDTDLRKDSDPEIEIDTDEVYSNGGGVDLGINYVMGEGNSGNAHQLYDNDDIMLDDGDTRNMPDGKRVSIGSESEPVLIAAQASALTPEKTQASVFPPDEHDQSNITQDSSPAAPEVTSPNRKSSHSPIGEQPAQPTRALEDQLPRSLVEDSSGLPSSPGNLKQAPDDLTGQETEIQRKDNIWSENTPTTIANEPMLQEEYQANEDTANTPPQLPATEHETEQQGIDLADESDSFDPHPVIVQYEQSHVSLFPPPNGVDLPFFVQDVDVCSKSIDVLFSELRNVLDESVSPEDELVIKVVDYGVEIGEDSKSSHEFSLQYILDLHVRLNLLDGNENPDALRLILFSRPSISGRVNFFLNSANEGIGYGKALCDAISKFNDSDTTPEQRFIEAGENTDFQEITGTGEHEVVSLIPFADDPDRPDEKDPNIAEEPKVGVIEQKEKVEENDGGDGDDFDLEYGNDDDTNDGGVVLKADVSESASHAITAPKIPPAPVSGVIEDVSKSLAVEVTAGVQYEIVPDGEQHTDTHVSDEGEGSISTVQDDEGPSALELEEELIEYEENEESESQQPSPIHEEELIGYEEHGESETQQPSPAREEALIGYEEYGEYEGSENQQPSPAREEELSEHEEHEEPEIQQPSPTRGFASSPAENRLGYHRQLSHEPPEVEHDRLLDTIGRRDSDFSYFFSSPGPSSPGSPPSRLDAGWGYHLTYLSAQGLYNQSNAYQDSLEDEAQKSIGSSLVDQADDAADKQESVDGHVEDHGSGDSPRIGGAGSYSIPVFEGNDGSEYSHNEEQPGYQEGGYGDQHEFGVGDEEGQGYGPEDEQYDLVESYEDYHGFDVQPEHPVGSFGDSGRFSEGDQNRYIGEDGELEEEYEPYSDEYPGGFGDQGHPSAEVGYSVDFKSYNEDQLQPDFEDDDDTVTGEANQSGVALDTDIHIVSDTTKQAIAPDEESLLEYDSDEDAARDLLPRSEKSQSDQKRAREELEQDDSVDQDYHSSRGKLLL